MGNCIKNQEVRARAFITRGVTRPDKSGLVLPRLGGVGLKFWAATAWRFFRPMGNFQPIYKAVAGNIFADCHIVIINLQMQLSTCLQRQTLPSPWKSVRALPHHIVLARSTPLSRGII